MNFVTGVVMVHCKLFKKWITCEFPLVIAEYKKLNCDVLNSIMREEITEHKSNGKNTDQLLWEKYDQLKNTTNSLSDLLKDHSHTTQAEKRGAPKRMNNLIK